MKTENNYGCFFFLMLGLIIFIIYLILVFIFKLFVFAGFNVFFFFDNLVNISFLNPEVTWGAFGLFVGSIIGVSITVKKFNLSTKLILFPSIFTLLIIIIMGLINDPLNSVSKNISTYNSITNIDSNALNNKHTDSVLSTMKSENTTIKDNVINKNKYFRIKIGITSDELLKIRGKAHSTSVIDKDDNGVIVEWKYSDATYLLKRLSYYSPYTVVDIK